MTTYTTQTLSDGVHTYDCAYCGQSFLEEADAQRHYARAHKPQMDDLGAYFRALPLDQFALIWTAFIARPIPKRERPREHFQRIFLRDTFAAEVARRGM